MTSATMAQPKPGFSLLRSIRRLRLPVHLALGALLLLWLIPTIGVFINSFRSADAITSSGWWTVMSPSGLTLDNYSQVLSQEDLGSKFLNSLYITIPATLIPTMLAAFTAYALRG